jgi:hypothetical protein
VIILDENFPESQRQLLRGWRVSIRQIGYEVGRKGMQDEEIIPLLLRRRHSTFFTLDLGLYRRQLCHVRYGLVCMDVGQYEAAAFVRRLLRHREFDTEAKRMAAVIRVTQRGLAVWHLHAEEEVHLEWLP